MTNLRNLMGWIFALTSLVCVCIPISFLVHIVRHGGLIPFRIQVIVAFFSVLAVIFGVSWWTVWKRKPTFLGWGIASSMIYILLSIIEIVHFSRSVLGSYGVVLAVGIIGLAAFSGTREQLPRASQTHSNGGTGSYRFHDLSKFVFVAFVAILSVGAYLWWAHWCKEKRIPIDHSIAHRHLLLMILIVPSFAFIATLQECGYILAGLLFGMKPRSFIAGPLHWCLRDGKWEFRFAANSLFRVVDGGGFEPAAAELSRWRRACFAFSGLIATLLFGVFALWLALFERGDSPVQAGGLLAFIGIFSLVISVGGLIPAVNSLSSWRTAT